jgi:uncharacterized protein HemY
MQVLYGIISAFRLIRLVLYLVLMLFRSALSTSSGTNGFEMKTSRNP